MSDELIDLRGWGPSITYDKVCALATGPELAVLVTLEQEERIYCTIGPENAYTDPRRPSLKVVGTGP